MAEKLAKRLVGAMGGLLALTYHYSQFLNCVEE